MKNTLPLTSHLVWRPRWEEGPAHFLSAFGILIEEEFHSITSLLERCIENIESQ